MQIVPLLYLACSAFNVFQNDFSMCQKERINYSLPKNIKPLRYLLTLEPNMSESYFNGSVTLEFKSLSITDFITLHVKDIEINNNLIKVKDQNGNVLPVYKCIIEQKRDFFTIYLNENMEAGIYYNLTITEFRGNISSDTLGLTLGEVEIYNQTK